MSVIQKCRDAVKDIVGVQFRNLATVGGSIWGRFGFSDVLTVFLAMDTYVELYQGGRIPLREFVGQKPDQDILVRLVIKKTSGCFSYASVRNQSTDFPVIACAASVVGGEYRLSVGARPGRAMLLLDEEGLLSEGLTEDSIPISFSVSPFIVCGLILIRSTPCAFITCSLSAVVLSGLLISYSL